MNAGPAPARPWLPLAALVGITALWGWSFLVVKEAVAGYPVFLFLALRFTLATFIVLPFLLRHLRRASRQAFAGGALMGLALFSGYALQTMGLHYTSASHSGVITGLFVVLAPAFETVLLRRLPTPLACGAVGMATLGLAVLSWEGGPGMSSFGDILCVGCAVAYAVHLLLTGTMARRHDTGVLVGAQLATVAACAWLFALPSLPRLLPVPHATWTGILVTALFATALAYFVQTTFQRHVSALQAALVFTLEPVFAGLFAVWLGGEELGWRGLAGGGLIVAGMLAGQWAEGRSVTAST